MNLESVIIVALISLMIGFVLGALLTRGHYLYIVMMQQRQALPPAPQASPRSQQRRTRHLYRDEDYY